MGRLIDEKEFFGIKGILNIGEQLNAGVYLLSVQNNSGVSVVRIIKE